MEWLLAHSDDYNEEMNIATDDGEGTIFIIYYY